VSARKTHARHAGRFVLRGPEYSTDGRIVHRFVGPLVRTKRGNIAILVNLDGFSKFVSFCPVRMISAQAVSDCLVRAVFPADGTPIPS
jgi:hypothetical protein